MPVQDYNLEPDDNKAISGINIGEGCPPGNVNNAIRQAMADIRAFYDVTREDLERVADGTLLPLDGETVLLDPDTGKIRIPAATTTSMGAAYVATLEEVRTGVTDESREGSPAFVTPEGVWAAAPAIRGIEAGEYIFLPGTKLPLNCIWVGNGLVIDVGEWPDLKQRIDDGYISLAPQREGYQGLWCKIPDGNPNAGPTKYWSPCFSGMFMRPWSPTQSYDMDREAGTNQGDAIRNIEGSFTALAGGTLDVTGSPLFTQSGTIRRYSRKGESGGDIADMVFKASAVVPTAAENRPVNAAIPLCIYLGRHVTEI